MNCIRSFISDISMVVFLACSLGVSCSAVEIRQKPIDTDSPAIIQHSAADAALCYEGRVDFTAPARPVFIWQGSDVRVDFEGDTLVLVFGACSRSCFFNLEIDGSQTVIELKEGRGPQRFKADVKTGARVHSLVLTKRSEADAGYAVFLGLELAAGAKLQAPRLPTAKLLMQFHGDSITVGA